MYAYNNTVTANRLHDLITITVVNALKRFNAFELKREECFKHAMDDIKLPSEKKTYTKDEVTAILAEVELNCMIQLDD